MWYRYTNWHKQSSKIEFNIHTKYICKPNKPIFMFPSRTSKMTISQHLNINYILPSIQCINHNLYLYKSNEQVILWSFHIGNFPLTIEITILKPVHHKFRTLQWEKYCHCCVVFLITQSTFFLNLRIDCNLFLRNIKW